MSKGLDSIHSSLSSTLAGWLSSLPTSQIQCNPVAAQCLFAARAARMVPALYLLLCVCLAFLQHSLNLSQQRLDPFQTGSHAGKSVIWACKSCGGRDDHTGSSWLSTHDAWHHSTQHNSNEFSFCSLMPALPSGPAVAR